MDTWRTLISMRDEISSRVPVAPDFVGIRRRGVAWAPVRAHCWAFRSGPVISTSSGSTTSEEAEHGLGDQETP